MSQLCASSAVALLTLPGVATADEVLKDLGTSWSYLYYREGDSPADPSADTVDDDFNETWLVNQSEFNQDYDGPSFQNGLAPLGFGEVPSGVLPVTNVWDPSDVDSAPADGERLGALYLRTRVTPTEEVNLLRFTGTIDDGVIIYVNGESLFANRNSPSARLRVPESAVSSWDLQAADLGNEQVESSILTEFLGLPAGEPIDIAISLHNSSASSSDIAWDVQIESVDQVLPQNDAFADAIDLPELLNTTSVTLPIMANTSDGDIGPGATREPGEPFHDGETMSSGSIWYRYTATGLNRRVWVSLSGSDFETILAVYTGDSVNALTPVKRYPNWPDSPDASSSDGDEPFYEGASVEFDAIAGETYYIAVDGTENEFGKVELRYGNAFTGRGPRSADADSAAVFEGINPIDELLSPGSQWDYLLFTDGSDAPADPSTADPDFFGSNGNPGWQTEAGYNGPAFTTASAPLGYGVIDALSTAFSTGLVADESNLWSMRGEVDVPPSDARYSAYFRTSFTPTKLISDLAVYGLFDDGAIIYINGEERARINIAQGADEDDWQLLAEDPRPKNLQTEKFPQGAIIGGLSLPANQPVEVAVSLHNFAADSSDLAFDLQIFEQAAPAVVNPPMTGDRPSVAISPSSTAGQFTFTWAWEEGVSFVVDFSPVLENPTWQVVAASPVTENAGIYTATVTLPSTEEKGFYRVREQ